MTLISRIHLLIDGLVSDRRRLDESKIQLMLLELEPILNLKAVVRQTQSEATALEGLEARTFSMGALGAGTSMEIHVWCGSGSFMFTATGEAINQGPIVEVIRRFLDPSGLNVRAIVRRPEFVV